MERTTFVATVKGGIGETLDRVLRAVTVQSIALSCVMRLMILIMLTAMVDTNRKEMLKLPYKR
jgi:hypothetical protein